MSVAKDAVTVDHEVSAQLEGVVGWTLDVTEPTSSKQIRVPADGVPSVDSVNSTAAETECRVGAPVLVDEHRDAVGQLVANGVRRRREGDQNYSCVVGEFVDAFAHGAHMIQTQQSMDMAMEDEQEWSALEAR